MQDLYPSFQCLSCRCNCHYLIQLLMWSSLPTSYRALEIVRTLVWTLITSAIRYSASIRTYRKFPTIFKELCFGSTWSSIQTSLGDVMPIAYSRALICLVEFISVYDPNVWLSLWGVTTITTDSDIIRVSTISGRRGMITGYQIFFVSLAPHIVHHNGHIASSIHDAATGNGLPSRFTYLLAH